MADQSLSILTSVKEQLGIYDDHSDFDNQIIQDINSTFMILNQLGVGPTKCFSISDDSAVWSDFLSNKENLEAVKTYIFLKVKFMFDPPLTSSVKDAMEKLISELEWRLNVMVDPGEEITDE